MSHCTCGSTLPEASCPQHGIIATLFGAPLDDEPFTDDEQAEVAEAQERIARGEGVPLKEES